MGASKQALKSPTLKNRDRVKEMDLGLLMNFLQKS